METIYYDEDGNPLEDPDLSDKLLERRDGRLTVVPLGDAAKRDAAVRLASLKASLAATDGDLVEALEGIFAATSLASLLSTLSDARESLDETLKERAELRAEITGIEKEGGD